MHIRERARERESERDLNPSPLGRSGGPEEHMGQKKESYFMKGARSRTLLGRAERNKGESRSVTKISCGGPRGTRNGGCETSCDSFDRIFLGELGTSISGREGIWGRKPSCAKKKCVSQ